MLKGMLGASAYGRLVKRYPFVKVLFLLAGVARWLFGRQQKRNARLERVDVDLADDEILVLTREKVRPTQQGVSSHG